MVAGLASPAYAVVPTVTAFTPSSGPGGCVVQITGTNFTNPIVTDVEFGNVNALDFVVKSDTEIWASAPGPGVVEVTNLSGSGFSATTFNAADPGGCAPTADSFTPTCGPAGTDVTITGTNLMLDSSTGAVVLFSPIPPGVFAPETTPATAPTLTSRTVDVPAGAGDGPITVATTVDLGLTATQFDVGTCITEISPTSGAVGATVTITGVGFQGATNVRFFNGIEAIFQIVTNTETVDTITATVPFGAATGPITVVSPGGTATSADFTIGAGGGHERNVTLKLSGALRMKGKVKVPDGTAECANGVSVRLQKKKKGGGWNTLKTVTTNDTGNYSGKVKNKSGKYRALAPKTTTAGGESCLKDVSPVRTN
jgi:hypothetical protein